MTISIAGTGSTVYSATSPITPVAPAHAIGDKMLCFVGAKADTVTVTTPSGWTLVGTVSGGSGSTGADTGPMKVYVFEKNATATNDTTGAITLGGTGLSVAAAKIMAYRTTTAWQSTAGVGAADTTTGTPMSAVMPSNPAMTVGDYLVAIGVIPTDVTTPAQFTNETVAATGMTTVTLTEIEEWDTTTGNDMGGWLAHGPVVTGTSSSSPTISATAAATNTNVAGPIFLTRLREDPPAPLVPPAHSSSPAVVKVTQAAALVTPSFTPLANAAIVVGYTSDDATGNSTGAMTISNTGGLTFTEIGNYRGSGGGRAALWVAKSGASPSAMTITCDNAGDTNSMPQMLLVRVYDPTDVDADDPIGAISQALITASTTNLSVSITPETTGGGLRMMYVDWNATGVPSTLQADTQIIDSWHVGGSSTNVQLGKTVGTVAASAQTIGATLPSASTSVRHITYELKAPASSDTPISGSDSGTLSATDATDDLTSTSTRTDTGTLSATDASSNASSLSRTETGTLSATDASSNAVFTATSDTGTLSATDTSSLVITNFVPVTDSGTLSATDASSLLISNAISTSDSGTLSATDASANTSTLSRTETGTFSATDASTNASTLATSDTGTLSATDASSLFVSNALSVNDTGTISAADTSSVIVTVVPTDAGTFSATDASTLFLTIPLTDSGTLSGTETSSVNGTGSLTDTSTLSATDTAAISVVVSTSDSGTLSATDTSSLDFPFNDINKVDSGTLSATDASAVLVTVATTDAGTFSATDASTQFKAIAVTDTGTISGADASAFYFQASGSDTGTISATDASSLYVQDAKSLTDTGTLSGTETSSISGTGSLTDTGTLSATDTSTVFKVIGLVDSGTISATDNSVNTALAPLTDSGILSATDSSSVTIFGTTDHPASDTGTVSATDASSVKVIVNPSDTGTISATDVIGTIPASSTRPDTGTVSASDSAVVLTKIAASDSGSLSGTDSSDVVHRTGTQTPVWDGTQFVQGHWRAWNGTAFVEVALWRWTGTSWSS